MGNALYGDSLALRKWGMDYSDRASGALKPGRVGKRFYRLPTRNRQWQEDRLLTLAGGPGG
jgi:hypothetical protein